MSLVPGLDYSKYRDYGTVGGGAFLNVMMSYYLVGVSSNVVLARIVLPKLGSRLMEDDR